MSKRRLQAQSRKVVVRYKQTVFALDAIGLPYVEWRHTKCDKVLERGQALPEVVVFGPRRSRIRTRLCPRLDEIERRRVFDTGYRLKDHSLNPRKNRGIQTDSDSQRRNDDNCQHRHFPERPARIADVPYGIV